MLVGQIELIKTLQIMSYSANECGATMTEVERKIIAMWNSGKSAKEISRDLGLVVDEIISVVVKFGVMEI